MKEAIRMVLKSIFDPEFPDTSHFRSGRGYHSALRQIKEKWGTSRWFLEFDIRKCFHTIDRHRLIPIFKEEIGDPKQHLPTQARSGDREDPTEVRIPIVRRIRSVLLRTGRIDDQEDSGEEASFNPPQDNKAIIVGRVKSIQRKAAFHSLVSSWHTPPTSTPRLRRDQKRSFVFPPESALVAFLNKTSSFLCAAFLIEAAELTPKAEFYELGGEAILVIRSERGLARKLAPLKSHYLIRICYARYADDLLLGIVGAVELLIEVKKLLAHFLQSDLNLWVGSAGSTTIATRSTVEFLGMVIREVPPRMTPIQFLRELEKRLRVKHRIHITACHLRSAIHSKFRNLGNSIPIKELTKGMSGTGSLLDAVQLADTIGIAGVRSPQVSVLWGTIKHIRQGSREISLLHSSGRSKVPSDVQQAVSRSSMSVRKLSLYTPAGRKVAGEGEGDWARSIRREFPIQIEVPIKKIL
ncbi:unnamed protein product [Lactuca saligna]|uniref:Reverse transcriptase domain-containing protein n=1 Tax=Lactuca saligna TaxID=75948 RepID=A0AA36E0A2_LACSI|nr:unnamed protein product [Lactuca saligna]